MLKDINGNEVAKIFKMNDRTILKLMRGDHEQKQAAYGSKKRRHKKRLSKLDNRRYMYISDLDVVSMMLDSIKKPRTEA